MVGRRSTALVVPGKAEREPRLRVPVHQDAREISIDPNEFIADSRSGVDLAQEALKFIAGDGLLIFLERLPFRRIGQRIAEVIYRGGGRGAEKEEEEWAEEEVAGGEDPEVKMTSDHGLDFRLFNTMLVGC